MDKLLSASAWLLYFCEKKENAGVHDKLKRSMFSQSHICQAQTFSRGQMRRGRRNDKVTMEAVAPWPISGLASPPMEMIPEQNPLKSVERRKEVENWPTF